MLITLSPPPPTARTATMSISMHYIFISIWTKILFYCWKNVYNIFHNTGTRLIQKQHHTSKCQWKEKKKSTGNTFVFIFGVWSTLIERLSWGNVKLLKPFSFQFKSAGEMFKLKSKRNPIFTIRKIEKMNCCVIKW